MVVREVSDELPERYFAANADSVYACMSPELVLAYDIECMEI